MTKILKYCAVCLVALGIVVGLSVFQFANDIEQATIDIREVAFAPVTKATDRIVMVWLDEATMAALPYRSPVPRDFLAKLNDRLSQAKPAAIGYDIYLKDPSFSAADVDLVQSLRRSKSYGVMPLRDGGTKEGVVDPPMPIFAKVLKGMGLADLPIAAFDTKVRSARLAYHTNEGMTPTFAALLFTASTGSDATQAVEAPWHWPTLGPLRFTPFSENGNSVLIRFAGPPSTIGSPNNAFKIFSAKMVVDGVIPLKWFADKIVLVGAAYSDLMDAYPTPYYARSTGFARMNGVEIHANILNSLLTGQFYYGFTELQRRVVVAIIILICAGMALFLPPMRSAIISSVIAAVVIIVAVYAFRSFGIVFPIVAPVIAIGAAYGVGILVRAFTEGRQKRMIKSIFARYVPAAVVDRIAKNPALAKLGGEERVITSMFTDIASFTSIAEHISPTKVVAFLNDYLEHMNRIIFELGGTIDKYEGDAVIAFFNAPLDVENHHDQALKAAIAIQHATHEVSGAWTETLGRELITRVGIHTGNAIVGNLGSEGRFDYTAIGDTINLASRLEGANKFYGTRVIASHETVKYAGDDIITRPVDEVLVKGRGKPVMLHEVVGIRSELDAKIMDGLVTPYVQSFSLFRERRIDDALAVFRELSLAFPEDGPTQVMLERCRYAKGNPDWNLVTELASK